MAKAPNKPEAPAGDAPPKKGGKMLMIIIIVVLVLLIVVAGAIGALILLKKGGGENGDHAEAPAAVAPPSAVDLSRPPVFAALDAFTVNLRREEGDHYLQAIIALRVTDQKTADALKGFMPEIRHRINLLLSSKLPSEVQTIEGREALALEILDQVNSALGFPPPAPGQRMTVATPVQSVLFNSFIIQ
ncbi:MAG: flagellar basal body protein FliL [Betaproteobacteria bacterium HGW-Betaproteobacteria-13]|jgi:flagellar FliL protein|uniref:Flagellar protein FliL n=1 Tax=Parazoarcus communis TaxID=41977 RepID=A0A2U8H2Y1_9RHOO|nr:flagellar basal body-associated FliL family protein [Parazoarcus communis]AWI80349.1 flagellar basal body protein FliL [Parazoarcus communis]PKO53365.1 MAG: flagellar basal body protein FliL [Betaproteobacteria bacterium HGW-Betaproteobacteria-21]PKO81458.1 MAG: flagellar basal body protein FliL [Betaproteobacteria bacterium HGW-Betaproteobacteria-13]